MSQTLLSAMQCDSVLKATRLGRPVEHSIIDKIRACSSTPNKAVDFFTRLLHPAPRCRLNATAALHHPYLANCLHLMRTGQQPDSSLRRHGHTRLADVRVRLAQHLHIPQALGMVKRVTGSIVGPLARPLSSRRSANTTLPHSSAFFPQRYTHCAEDHELPPLVQRSQLQDRVNIHSSSRSTSPVVIEQQVLQMPAVPDKALPHALIDENTSMPLRRALERVLRPGAQRAAMPSEPCYNPACILQGNCHGLHSQLVPLTATVPTRLFMNRTYVRPRFSDTVASECYIEEVAPPSLQPRVTCAPPQPDSPPTGVQSVAAPLASQPEDLFADWRDVAPEPAGPSADPLHSAAYLPPAASAACRLVSHPIDVQDEEDEDQMDTSVPHTHRSSAQDNATEDELHSPAPHKHPHTHQSSPHTHTQRYNTNDFHLQCFTLHILELFALHILELFALHPCCPLWACSSN